MVVILLGALYYYFFFFDLLIMDMIPIDIPHQNSVLHLCLGSVMAQGDTDH